MLDQELIEAVEKFELAFTREPDVEKRPGVLTAFKAGWDALAKLLGADEDRHTVTIDPDSGWRMVHPLDCRIAGLHQCAFAIHLTAHGIGARTEGDFVMIAPDGGGFLLIPVA